MKTILASAAVLFALSAGTAAAGERATTVTEIQLDGFCNIYTVTMHRNLASVQDTPDCTGTYGGGLIATTRVFGKSVMLALQDQVGAPGVQMMVQISYPFTSGGAFRIFQTTDGTNFQDAYDGTYEVVDGGGGAVVHPKGGKPVSSVFHPSR